MDKFHPENEIEDVSSDLPSEDEEKSNPSNDIFNGSEIDDNSSNEIEEETENSSESEEEEEPDFWNILIRRVVTEICTRRKADGKTPYLPFMTSANKMAEGKYLSQFANRLRMTYYEIEKIHNAGIGDSVLDLIENELEKLKTNFMDESFEEEISEMAWKKYKPLIRKRILQNLEELEVLVCNENAMCQTECDNGGGLVWGRQS